MSSALIALTVLFSGAAFAQQDLSQSGLVGKLENPTIITDPAQWPKKIGEAPALAELVKAGKLPAVGPRIPHEPRGSQPRASDRPQERPGRRHQHQRLPVKHHPNHRTTRGGAGQSAPPLSCAEPAAAEQPIPQGGGACGR